jgi:2-haloacid dehalogenase/putative hydrolase of the HAD superfamily
MTSDSRGQTVGPCEGVFVDFYGTIASGDVQAVESVCREVIDDYGLSVSARDLATDWGRRYFMAIEAMNGDGFRLLREIEADTLIDSVSPFVGRVDVNRYIDDLNAYLARPTLFEEVPEVLAAMRLPICIVSNADERELRSALAYHELRPDFVVSSEGARSYKPERRIFEAALELTGWSADRVLHVGDSLHSDVGGAREAGIRSAWVNRATRISDIGTEVPDWTWSDLRPLALLVP